MGTSAARNAFPATLAVPGTFSVPAHFSIKSSHEQPRAFLILLAVVMRMLISPASMRWTLRMFRVHLLSQFLLGEVSGTALPAEILAERLDESAALCPSARDFSLAPNPLPNSQPLQHAPSECGFHGCVPCSLFCFMRIACSRASIRCCNSAFSASRRFNSVLSSSTFWFRP
jgi:hypothetical protein